jgi:tRNA G18 (ribose-2'-O)-methylase SpoU
MEASFYEIRLCQSCGLRYPLLDSQSFGMRCPSCLGETKCELRASLARETPSEGECLPEGFKLHVLLDNVRSAWNVGSILRTADGFGFEHAYICGITPTPEKPEVLKTSLGAEEFVTWSKHPNGLEKVRELHVAGWQILALEKIKESVPIQDGTHTMRERHSLLVVGNEVTGVDPQILEISDQVVHIPMRGQKRSFNVAIAFAIAAAIIHNAHIDFP